MLRLWYHLELPCWPSTTIHQEGYPRVLLQTGAGVPPPCTHHAHVLPVRAANPTLCQLCVLNFVLHRVCRSLCGGPCEKHPTHGCSRPLSSQDGAGATGLSSATVVDDMLSKTRPHSRSGVARARDGRPAILRAATVAVTTHVPALGGGRVGNLGVEMGA